MSGETRLYYRCSTCGEILTRESTAFPPVVCDRKSAALCEPVAVVPLAAWEAAQKALAAASEVWDSVPAVYDEKDPTVKRHAAALTDLGAALRAAKGGT